MGLAATNVDGYVDVESATQSDHLELLPGKEYQLSFTSAGAFVLDLQMLSANGTKWSDVYDRPVGGTKVTINSASGNQEVIVSAGSYRMDVDTFNSTIRMSRKAL